MKERIQQEKQRAQIEAERYGSAYGDNYNYNNYNTQPKISGTSL